MQSSESETGGNPNIRELDSLIPRKFSLFRLAYKSNFKL